MAEIVVSKDGDVRIIKVRGDLAQREIVGVLQQHYPTFVESLLFWDLTGATMTHVTIEQLREVASLVKTYREAPDGAKTAYVATDTRAFTLVCMYTAEAAMTRSRVDYSAFRSIEEAMRWLRE